MLRSLILQTSVKLLTPLMLLFSVFLLLRGHDESGGGFIGGLVAAGAFALYAAAYGSALSRRTLRVTPLELMSVGVGLALAAGLVPLFFGEAILTGLWVEFTLGGADIKTGTVLLFDIGVYLLVIGTVLTVIYELDLFGLGLFPREEASQVPDEYRDILM